MNQVKFSLFLPTGDFAKARAAAEWADTHGFYAVSMLTHRRIRHDLLHCVSEVGGIARSSGEGNHA